MPVLKPSLKITYSMPYRGATQLWSNRYHFDGLTGLSPANWAALVAAVEPDARTIIPSTCHVVEYTGYEAGSDVPVFSSAVSLAGIGAFGSDSVATPGDVAALVRYTTTQRTSKNHPIYLFNYYHHAFYNPAVGVDTISVDYKAALSNLAQLWVTGIGVAGATLKRCGPNGAVAQSRTVEDFLTHRDFRR